MKHLRIMAGFVLFALLMTVYAPVSYAKTPAIRMEDPTNDDKLFSCAKSIFDENEEIIRTAVKKMLESGIERIDIRYRKAVEGPGNKYTVYDEAWAYYEDNGDKVELLDAEYLNLANCTEDVGFFSLQLCGNVVAVNLENQYDPIDFLRVHTFGYYYIPGVTNESEGLEDILAENMPQRWVYETKVMDEYQLVCIADDFIYYHWHG